MLDADEFAAASFLPDVSQTTLAQSLLHLEGLHKALEHLLFMQVGSVILVGAENWHKVVLRATQAIRITHELLDLRLIDQRRFIVRFSLHYDRLDSEPMLSFEALDRASHATTWHDELVVATYCEFFDGFLLCR